MKYTKILDLKNNVSDKKLQSKKNFFFIADHEHKEK